MKIALLVLSLMLMGSASPLNASVDLVCSETVSWTQDNLTEEVCSSWTETHGGLHGATCNGYKKVCKNNVCSLVCMGIGYGACFPGHTKVQLENGFFAELSSLEIGDAILVGTDPKTEKPIYESVLDIPHRNAEQFANFIRITFNNRIASESSSLLISPKRLIYVRNELEEDFDSLTAQTKFAQDLKTGDWIGSKNQPAVITDIEYPVSAKGIFAPHTESGRFVAFGDTGSGALVSCYSDVKDPSLAHEIFKWRRYLSPPKKIADLPIREASLIEMWILKNIYQNLPFAF